MEKEKINLIISNKQNAESYKSGIEIAEEELKKLKQEKDFAMSIEKKDMLKGKIDEKQEEIKGLEETYKSKVERVNKEIQKAKEKMQEEIKEIESRKISKAEKESLEAEKESKEEELKDCIKEIEKNKKAIEEELISDKGYEQDISSIAKKMDENIAYKKYIEEELEEIKGKLFNRIVIEDSIEEIEELAHRKARLNSFTYDNIEKFAEEEEKLNSKETKKNEEKVNSSKIEQEIDDKDIILEKYKNDGFGKNASGWYFNPVVDEYDKDYDPHNDKLYNNIENSSQKVVKPEASKTEIPYQKAVKTETSQPKNPVVKNSEKLNSNKIEQEEKTPKKEQEIDDKDIILERYKNDGFGKNAFGWYFNPGVDEYDKDYDPHNDKLYNNIKNESKKDNNSKWHSKLTEEQIEELKADNIRPGDSEYYQALWNYGINPTKKDNLDKANSFEDISSKEKPDFTYAEDDEKPLTEEDIEKIDNKTRGKEEKKRGFFKKIFDKIKSVINRNKVKRLAQAVKEESKFQYAMGKRKIAGISHELKIAGINIKGRLTKENKAKTRMKVANERAKFANSLKVDISNLQEQKKDNSEEILQEQKNKNDEQMSL